ncbi:myosin light chain kinase 3 isoform X2 [Chiloscyllium plagiosum]|uniref:myosin light chain kinase 3 isoform X2 n=1 Tax=Chiloscyllium plagiosum TaxID=36176 RepID=UPI001CB849ED|nr:myosin light chain kinase 3 isoform X2 [Chiloscyllium plagiosum]XP_043575330.1 myosin light chain kinase 3 isoform X2 [Chiloscyllium plagiosum]
MNTPPRKNSSTLVHSLAKVFDSNAMQNQGPPVITGPSTRLSESTRATSGDALSVMDIKLESLSQTVEKLLGFQEKVVQKLDGITQDVDKIGRKVEMLTADRGEAVAKVSIPREGEHKSASVPADLSDLLSKLTQSSREQTKKMDGIESMLVGVQQVINYIGETLKNSRIAEFILKGQFASRGRGGDPQRPFRKGIASQKLALRRKREKVKDQQSGDVKGKQNLNIEEIKSQQKKKPPDSTAIFDQEDGDIFRDQKIDKLNKENANNTSLFEDPNNIRSQAKHKSVAKLKGKPFEKDIGVYGPQSTSSAEGTSSVIAPEITEAILDSYGGNENKEDTAVKEQCDIKPGKSFSCAETQTGINRQNDERTEKNNVMYDKIVDNRSLENVRTKEDNGNINKELMSESESDGRKENVINEENEETENKCIKDDGSNEEVKGTSLESTNSEFTIAERSKVKDIVSQVDELPEDQEIVCHGKNCTVLLNRYEDSEREAEALLAAAAEPEEGTSQETEPHAVKDLSPINKRRGTGESSLNDDNKKSRVEEKGCSQEDTTEPASCLGSATSTASQKEINQATKECPHIVIDDGPAPPAPFEHRIVSANMAHISNYYTIYKSEVLGGGRFGQVHKCVEKSTGLTLAAKIIKTRAAKHKEEVRNEIQVMNQLNHTNLIQLYDAFESRNDITLIMEYIDGGELFDRIIDESYNLTEMDTILFVKQICEGLQYMHQRYILHLDLKPENILCVNREANQVKIIDFGLARRYKPREKLKINFGTPEFLAPEVVNYDFVSFPTDMWSLGVITYMLLSGLSPFLGEDDNETLNNILVCKWDLDDAEFENVSEDAKEFISKLLIKEKGWRISANEALKHPWLSDCNLHYKLSSKCKNKCHPVPQTALAK